MPATRADKLPPIDVGAWLRIGARFQGTDPKKLNDQSMDSIYGELHAGGKIHKNVSVTLNLNANGLAAGAGIEDAIIGFDFAEPFHLWVGQLLVPADRANEAGPFFMIPWNYPGFFTVGSTTVVGAPAEGPYGRNAGAVVWGDFGGGVFKYKLGAFNSTVKDNKWNAGDTAARPLFSGRLNLAIVGKEEGFWGNATYFGDKDVVALGVSGQYQKDGNPGASATERTDYSEVSADALVEYRVGGGAWVTGEAAYYHFGGDFAGIKDEFSIMGAFASPTVGMGNIQPMVRYQMAKNDTLTVSAIDVGLSYLIKGPALRAVATFQHVDLDNDITGNSLQLSAQAIFF